MFIRPFTFSQLLFFGSISLPYLLDLIPVHSANSGIIEFLFLDFIALLIVGVTSLVLALGTAELRSSGKGLIYPVIGFAAVISYFYSLNTRIQIREQIIFYSHKSELEAYAARFIQSLPTSDSINIKYHSLHVNNSLYPQHSPGIIFYTTEREAGIYSGGYAYSPEDKKPSDTNYYEWLKVSRQWYKWKRSEGNSD